MRYDFGSKDVVEDTLRLVNLLVLGLDKMSVYSSTPTQRFRATTYPALFEAILRTEIACFALLLARGALEAAGFVGTTFTQAHALSAVDLGFRHDGL